MLFASYTLAALKTPSIMKNLIIMLGLLFCTAIASAQTLKPSVFQVYKVHFYNPVTESITTLNVDYPLVITEGTVSLDNAGDEKFTVVQSTVKIQEVANTTTIYSRGIDNKGKFVDMKLHLSKKPYFQVITSTGFIVNYYFTTY